MESSASRLESMRSLMPGDGPPEFGVVRGTSLIVTPDLPGTLVMAITTAFAPLALRLHSNRG